MEGGEMRICPIEIKVELGYFELNIFPVVFDRSYETELFGLFYNNGSIIITLFFKQFFLRERL
jgi:hypothetical protein